MVVGTPGSSMTSAIPKRCFNLSQGFSGCQTVRARLTLCSISVLAPLTEMPELGLPGILALYLLAVSECCNYSSLTRINQAEPAIFQNPCFYGAA